MDTIKVILLTGLLCVLLGLLIKIKTQLISANNCLHRIETFMREQKLLTYRYIWVDPETNELRGGNNVPANEAGYLQLY